MKKEITSQFVELDNREIESKIAQLIRSNEKLNVLRKKIINKINPPVNFERRGGSFYLLFTLHNDNFVKDQKYPASFKLRGVTFYFLFKLVDNKNKKEQECEIVSSVYKFEKRNIDRLFTYPHYSFHLEVKIFNNEASRKIIPLRPLNIKNMELIGKHQNIGQEQNGERIQYEHGLRILDLSSSGLSFISNKIERSYFEKNKMIKEITIRCNSHVFKVKSGVVEYIVDFINSKAPNVKMYKIGMNFLEISRELHEFLKQNTSYEQITRKSILDDFVILLEQEEELD